MLWTLIEGLAGSFDAEIVNLDALTTLRLFHPDLTSYAARRCEVTAQSRDFASSDATCDEAEARLIELMEKGNSRERNVRHLIKKMAT